MRASGHQTRHDKLQAQEHLTSHVEGHILYAIYLALLLALTWRSQENAKPVEAAVRARNFIGGGAETDVKEHCNTPVAQQPR